MQQLFLNGLLPSPVCVVFRVLCPMLNNRLTLLNCWWPNHLMQYSPTIAAVLKVSLYFQGWISSVRWGCSQWVRDPRRLSLWEPLVTRLVLNTYLNCFFLLCLLIQTGTWMQLEPKKLRLLLLFSSLDGNGGSQDGAAQRKPASESVFVSRAISRSWTRSWTNSAWDCPAWLTDKHATGKKTQIGN